MTALPGRNADRKQPNAGVEVNNLWSARQIGYGRDEFPYDIPIRLKKRVGVTTESQDTGAVRR
jgi:hypothetical protein